MYLPAGAFIACLALVVRVAGIVITHPTQNDIWTTSGGASYFGLPVSGPITIPDRLSQDLIPYRGQLRRATPNT